MSGRQTARRVDAEPDWARRRFREIEGRLADLSTSTVSSVPGSTVTIQQLLTDPGGITLFCNTDMIVAEGPGDVALTLSHTPLDGSLHVRWNGRDLPGSAWSLAGNVLTITDPDSLFLAEDELSTAYAYDSTVPAPEPPTGGTLLAFEASGWKWLQVGRTDATDYSAAAFDDSAWASAAGAFGDGGDMIDPALPAHTTQWDMTTRMWARRTLTGITIAEDIHGTIRSDESTVIYLGGVQVWTGTPNGYEVAFTINAADVTAASMVLACRTTDGSSSLGCYFDLELIQ